MPPSDHIPRQIYPPSAGRWWCSRPPALSATVADASDGAPCCQLEAGKGAETPHCFMVLSLPPYLGVGVEERSECCAARTYGRKWDRKPRKVGPQTPSFFGLSVTAFPVTVRTARPVAYSSIPPISGRGKSGALVPPLQSPPLPAKSTPPWRGLVSFDGCRPRARYRRGKP